MFLYNAEATTPEARAHSQFQQLSPQLFLVGVLVTCRLQITSHFAIQGVLARLVNKWSDKMFKIGTTPAEREHIILLLLLRVRYRQFSHLVQDRRQGHAQGRGLAAAKGHQHWEVIGESEMTLLCQASRAADLGACSTCLKWAQQQMEALCYGDRMVVLLQLFQKANQQLFGSACLESHNFLSIPTWIRYL